MLLNNQKLAFIASIALIGFASAEDPVRPSGTALTAPGIHVEYTGVHDKLKHSDQVPNASIDANAVLAAKSYEIEFKDRATMMYKTFHLNGRDGLLVGYQVSPDKDVFFSNKATPDKIQNLIDGAERIVIHEGPKNGHYYRSTLLLFNQDWAYSLTHNVTAEKRTFLQYMTRRTRDMVEKLPELAPHFHETFDYRIPHGVHFMIISEPFTPQGMFPVAAIPTQYLESYAGKPQTRMYRIEDVFNEPGNYGVYYEIGYDLPIYPNMDKLQHRSTWKESSHVTGFKVTKDGQKYTIYFKIQGVSVPEKTELRRIALHLIDLYGDAYSQPSWDLAHNWTIMFTPASRTNDVRFPADWFSHTSLLKKNVKILVVRN